MTQMTLPDAPGLAAVIAALDGNVRLVGGVVRDTLAGLPTKDIDLATSIAPDQVMLMLNAAGLEWYEVSNWARPGGECRHNLAYWRNADWWGFGPGAHSALRLDAAGG